MVAMSPNYRHDDGIALYKLLRRAGRRQRQGCRLPAPSRSEDTVIRRRGTARHPGVTTGASPRWQSTGGPDNTSCAELPCGSRRSYRYFKYFKRPRRIPKSPPESRSRVFVYTLRQCVKETPREPNK
ncbi:hypothetical protein E2C01_039896 [Portunus trituberculatus]|uniref:Uncharacterized protein n=1 Tax=Portunus trituberculatus TaxID=210409 RepID=A0A5B7FL83_PORTR|nr:hypothetical protein [Portunus trituberculatus]